MKDFIGLGEKGIKDLQKMNNELKELQETDDEIFSNIESESFYKRSEIKLKAPISNPQKIICLGRNFAEHAKEGGAEVPKNPMIWGKFNSAIIGPEDAIQLPAISDKIDVEIELVVVIGKRGKHIPEEQAHEYIAGFMIGNDVSARDYQYADKQFTRSKTMDTFCPLGPWIVTKDEIEDQQNLSLKLSVNNKVWQESNTKHMIFPINYIISYLSKSFTFEAGDLIFTGTPSGVGHYQNPPVYLQEGDVVKLEIEKIGTLENKVIKEE
ncbi:MAG: fumarylacetoacetate hydrolase family protein, partial [Asgard group archaeon]|nr:fumarylacetoacetate hydrolase family protein [Asgard group archaeon]